MSYHRVTLRICFVLLLLTIDNVVNLASTIQRHSDVALDAETRRRSDYVESGDDQTAIHRWTIDEKLALEHEILKLLGLPDKPKSTNGKAPLIKRSAPKFLLNVYKNNANKEREKQPTESVEPSEFGLTGNDLRTIDESDVIITFTAQQSHQGAGGKPDRVKRIWFDVDTLPAEDQMTSAVLRLYRGPEAKNRKNRGAFTVAVYRVLRTKDGEREMELVDSANTTAGHEGWITLNVTESLLHWMKHPSDNKGLYLSVRPIDRSSHETRPEDIGIVGFKGDAERQPFMAGFFKSNETDKARLIQPTLRNFEDYNKRNKKRYAPDVQDLLNNRYTNMTNQTSGSSCKIENLYVSFKDLMWQDWIIAPEGYNANYCGGECNFPLNTRMNATNHAIVQTLANLLHPDKVPKPCCAPTNLSTIEVLYFLSDHNVILRKYKNMSVQGCGCH